MFISSYIIYLITYLCIFIGSIVYDTIIYYGIIYYTIIHNNHPTIYVFNNYIFVNIRV